jgi:hypothetical protein
LGTAISSGIGVRTVPLSSCRWTRDEIENYRQVHKQQGKPYRGMTLMDTTDGLLMSMAYNWAFLDPVESSSTTSQ